VVVAEVRETSRKPDEVYGVIERYVYVLSLWKRWNGKLITDSHLMVGNWNCLGENIIPGLGG